VSLYHCHGLFCELCKTPFPTIFNIRGKPVEVISIERPKCKSYIVIEAFGKETRVVKAVYVIPGKEEIKLGRGHENDLRISDISVSRCHAFFKFNKEGVFL
jgi:hypothetical protein